jgi:hypothetical protein
MTAPIMRHVRTGIGHTIPHRSRASARVRTFFVLGAILLTGSNVLAQDAAGGDVRACDPFRSGSWQLELTGHGALETWNYNISHEEMYGTFAGLSYGLRDGLALTVSAPLYYIDQRGIDGWLLGATFGVRGRVYRRSAMSVFLGFEVGVSEADTFVPPRGTRFNYLALGSGGVTVRVKPRVHVLAGLKWVHVSNNGLAGRQRNPDIEAVGIQLGVLIGF